jgi:hypothetical protein
LFPVRKNKDGTAAEPTRGELDRIVGDSRMVAERRRRLSDISWWMRCLAEVIARRANREDQCKGRFWEGRFKAQLLLDEASLLACAAYVDLNPIRAAMARSPEKSDYTGAKDRLDDLRERKGGVVETHSWERHSQRRRKSGWLSPVEIREAVDAPGPDVCRSGRRASEKGFLSLSLGRYLELLDWTGRQWKEGKTGRIPAELAPILDRLGLSATGWQTLVTRFGRTFKRAAGTADHLAAEAQRRGQRWMQAPGSPFKDAA